MPLFSPQDFARELKLAQANKSVRAFAITYMGWVAIRVIRFQRRAFQRILDSMSIFGNIWDVVEATEKLKHPDKFRRLAIGRAIQMIETSDDYHTVIEYEYCTDEERKKAEAVWNARRLASKRK